MADVQLPVSRGPRSMTAMFGEDSNDSQQPLWFKKDVFLQSDFESESYIADLRRFIALDTLRAELRGHLAVLKNELVELINRDYADFVNLTTKLVDVEGAVLRMRTPLTELRAKISSVKDSVDSSLLALQNGLQRRAEASSSREILELLLDTAHVVSKVEKLMVELQSMPEEGPISQIEPASKSSFSNGTMAEIFENGANLEETRSMLLERIASEMNRLKFYIARAQNLPFIQNMEKRIQSASLSLDNSLCRCFEIGLECRDENVIYNCLRAYAAIDNTKAAEEAFRSTIVARYIQQIISSTPPRDVGDSSDRLEDYYQQIKKFVENDCKFLLDIAASANSGLHVFDFLANSILKEVLSAIQKGKPGAFSPGKPAEFLINYKSSMDFLTFLEGNCLTKSAVDKFRSQPVYNDFVKQWNLGAYFTLRFQEIASALDSALVTASISPLKNSHPQQDGVLGLTLNQSVVLLECLHRCWQDDVYIAAIADKFLRLTLQLLSRYSTWLSTGLSTHKRGGPSSNTGGEWALVATPEDFIFVRRDVDLLVKEVNGPYLEHAMNLLVSCPNEVLALVKQSILHISQALLDSVPIIMDVMIEAVVEKSVEVLRQLKGITATYRMTNKPLPVRHSPYVSGVLQPLKAFLEGERAIYLTEKTRNELLQSAAEIITTRYNELAWELVTVARKTESSLQRIRQGAQRTRGGAGTDSSDGNISDTDKICMQLFLDVQTFSGCQFSRVVQGKIYACLYFLIFSTIDSSMKEYGRRLAALGVAATEIPVYTSLWQCVAPPDRQSSIHF